MKSNSKSKRSIRICTSNCDSNLVKSKRSQMKIQEMSFMLIFLAVFFIIVFLFFISVSMSGLKKSVYQSSREGAVLLLSKLADSPEFSCGSEGLCVDTDKLVVFITHVNYQNFWNVNGLVIERVYPYENTTLECSKGNYPNCNTFTVKKPSGNFIPDVSFVSLCRRDSKNGYPYLKCELGRIKVYTEKTS